MSIAEVLDSAARRLGSDGSRWTRWAMTRDGGGSRLSDPHSDMAVSWCVIGAVVVESENAKVEVRDVVRYLADKIRPIVGDGVGDDPFVVLTAWNDTREDETEVSRVLSDVARECDTDDREQAVD